MMGAMKSLIMDIEYSVHEAMALGAKSKEEIYAYVYANVGNVSKEMVYSIVDAYDEWPNDEEYYRETIIH